LSLFLTSILLFCFPHFCAAHRLLVAVLLLASAGALWYAADEPFRQVQVVAAVAGFSVSHSMMKDFLQE
jgi:hypothetical protein